MAPQAAPQAIQQPSRRSPTPSHWSNAGTTTAASRLRDSCHSCAISKVKCSKEKPKCSRCVKRATACEYLITKRPGRKHENRTVDRVGDLLTPPEVIANALQPSTTSNWRTAFPSPPNAASMASPFSLQPPLASTFPDLGAEFDDFFGSPISFPIMETSDFDVLDQSNMFSDTEARHLPFGSTSNKSAPSDQSDDTIYLFGDRSRSPSMSTSKATGPMAAKKRRISESRRSTPSHRCLPRALDVLNRLSLGCMAPCSEAEDQSHGKNSEDRLATAQSIISKNETAINDIGRILHCSCATNGFVLTIIVLVVFKVLDWYAIAVHASGTGSQQKSGSHSLPSPCSSRRVSTDLSGGHYMDEVESRRQSAQAVLVELHKVQRLLSQLSPKLREYGHRSKVGVDAASSHAERLSAHDAVYATLPLSEAVLDQWEPELRRHVRALSLEIIDLLKRDE